MTYQNINEIMEELSESLDCAYAYSAFKEGKRNRFLIFYYDDSDDLYADNINYQSIVNLVIEFYAPNKEIASEKKIQDILASHEMSYDKSNVYISGEKLHETIYYTEVVINEQS